jgi:L-asparaginase / beta-aspartyl-peptidase
LDVGAVGSLQGFRHPISVAARMLYKLPTLMCGADAALFATGCGAERLLPGNPPKISCSGGDTVGCIVRDQNGHFAVGSSTGGLAERPPGALGDAPLPGCGFYADDAVGAVACSGDGEQISRTIFAGRLIHALEAGKSPASALKETLPHMARVKGEVGAIIMSKSGAWSWDHNCSHFAIGFACKHNPEGFTRLRKQENE